MKSEVIMFGNMVIFNQKNYILRLKCNSDTIFKMNYQVENYQALFFSTHGQISNYCVPSIS